MHTLTTEIIEINENTIELSFGQLSRLHNNLTEILDDGHVYWTDQDYHRADKPGYTCIACALDEKENEADGEKHTNKLMLKGW